MFLLLLSIVLAQSQKIPPSLYCYKTTDYTYGLPHQICLSRATWTNNPDGDMVVTVYGPEINAQMDEVLPRQTYEVATVSTSFIQRIEQCGDNIHSDIYISNIQRNKDINLAKVEVSVALRYTSDNCDPDVKYTQAILKYKLVN